MLPVLVLLTLWHSLAEWAKASACFSVLRRIPLLTETPFRRNSLGRVHLRLSNGFLPLWKSRTILFRGQLPKEGNSSPKNQKKRQPFLFFWAFLFAWFAAARPRLFWQAPFWPKPERPNLRCSKKLVFLAFFWKKVCFRCLREKKSPWPTCLLPTLPYSNPPREKPLGEEIVFPGQL